MMRDVATLPLIVCVAAILAGAVADSCDAQAQDRPATRDERDVARCLVAEDERGGDWPAILDVLELRAAAHGMRPASMARAYCAIFVSRAPSARQARILALPGGRPSRRLAAVYTRALVAARRGGPGTCRAEHWGSAQDVRKRWPRAVVVDCGRTRNVMIGATQ